MPAHSFRCDQGHVSEYMFSLQSYPYPDVMPCAVCHLGAVRFFERAPGMQPDIWQPTFDLQAGRYFSSKRQRDEYLASKNLQIVSTEEFDKTIATKELPDEVPFDSKRWHESAQKALNDIHYGNVEVPPPVSLDEADQPIITVGREQL